MNTVAIVGVGLIGGSFALALRKAGFSGEILGVSSAAAIEAAKKAGAIDRGVPLEQAAGSDLIYLAQPVDRILATLAILGEIAPAHCLITDAGSTKTAIVRQAAQHVRTARFLGGHPMAGKESRGVESAEAGLFAGRPYVLMPFPDSENRREQEFSEWLGRIGTKVLIMTPEQHDTAVAWSSHLPQILSTGLAATLSEAANPDIELVVGPGLLDMTRLALSPPDLWESILNTNREPILGALDGLVDQLKKLKVCLQEDKLDTMWREAGTFSRSLRSRLH